jgi:protein SCO1/2
MRIFSFIVVLTIFTACTSPKEKNNSNTESAPSLPIYGQTEYDPETKDSIYHQIGFFSFHNQNKEEFLRENMKGKVVLVDFFFTHCPLQCPKMTNSMKRVQQHIKDERFMLVSHTIDPENDTAERYQAYIKEAGIDDSNWQFLYAPLERTKKVAEESYLVTAGISDDGVEMGDLHSPYLILVDTKLRIRGYYDGTKSEEIDQLIEDTKLLLNESK